MSIFLASAFLLAGADPSARQKVWPKPEAFLEIAESELSIHGYFLCAGEYGWHLISGTELSLDDALDKSIADCSTVREAAFQSMTRDNSIFRAVTDEKSGKIVTKAKLQEIANLALDTTAKNWVEGVRPNAEIFRASDDYDPAACDVKYRAEVEAGVLVWDRSE